MLCVAGLLAGAGIVPVVLVVVKRGRSDGGGRWSVDEAGDRTQEAVGRRSCRFAACRWGQTRPGVEERREERQRETGCDKSIVDLCGKSWLF